MLFLVVTCGVVACLGCAFLIEAGRASAARYGQSMPQRFHAGHVPRIGGAAIFLGCSVGWAAMALVPGPLGLAGRTPTQALAWWSVMLLAAGAGLLEDITHRVGARWRLLLTLLGGGVAALALDARIERLDLPWLETFWAAAPWLGAVLAVVAIGGLPHAFNLIDGYNGLAGGVALVGCLALAWVAQQVGDAWLAGLAWVTAGATAGFLVWNYPRGRVFAGDGGAYLWGAVMAVISVQLVQRHAQVSAWFPALLLIYPIWEALFSIYRKIARGQSPGKPDALHFHQLIYRRVVRDPVAAGDPARMLSRNNRTSPYLWALNLMAVIPAALFWRDSAILMVFCAVFVAFYVASYLRIARFRVPSWIRLRLKS